MSQKYFNASYLKPKAYYDVESLYSVFTTIFEDSDTGRYYVVYDGSVPISKEEFASLGLTLIDREQVKVLMEKRQLVGFNNRGYDDFMLAEWLDGKNYRELFELSQKLIHTKEPPFLWDDKPKDLFSHHTIDILVYLTPTRISLKQAASEMGMNVEEFELDFDLPIELTKEDILQLIQYNVNDVDVTGRLFEHDSVQTWYEQHVAVIEKYLPEADWAIFMTNAALSERALTQHKTLKVEMAETFDWKINGLNVFEEIDVPEQWKEAVLDYAEEIELGVHAYKRALIRREGTPRELGKKYIQSVPNPTIEPFLVNDQFRFKPGLGGAHSDYLVDGQQATAHFKHVLHSDISGAYGTLAIPSNQFGEATPVYKQFMEDKVKTKEASREIQRADFDAIDVDAFLKHLEETYDIDTKGLRDKEALLDQVMRERSATKLGTNDSTGKSDQPGSILYNPVVIKQNRILLQMIIYDLCQKLSDAGATLLSANTDGVFYHGSKTVLFPIVQAWGEKWNFTVDSEMIDEYIGKDDNHRLLIHDGKLIESAGELRHYHFDAKYPASLPRLVDTVITEKFLYPEKSIRKLMESHKDDVELFAWTLKPTTKHKSALDYKLTQRINRVLLTTEGQTIQNYSVTKDKVEKFRHLDLNNKVTVINKAIPEKLPDNLDWDAYEDLIQSRYELWL